MKPFAIGGRDDLSGSTSSPTGPDRSGASERLRLRTIALSRWENEGGAGIDGHCAQSRGIDTAADSASGLGDAESVQLRIRVIALENLVIALYAHAPDTQRALAREMAAYISPRPGYTPHQLTLRAADEMRSLVDRADHFRATPAA